MPKEAAPTRRYANSSAPSGLRNGLTRRGMPPTAASSLRLTTRNPTARNPTIPSLSLERVFQPCALQAVMYKVRTLDAPGCTLCSKQQPGEPKVRPSRGSSRLERAGSSGWVDRASAPSFPSFARLSSSDRTVRQFRYRYISNTYMIQGSA